MLDIHKMIYYKFDHMTEDEFWKLLRSNRFYIPRKEGMNGEQRYNYLINCLLFQGLCNIDDLSILYTSQTKVEKHLEEQINKNLQEVVNNKSRFKSYMVKNNKI